MILHPGVLAILVGSGAVLAFVLVAAHFGTRVITHWDAESGSREQFRLEKTTYLISTLMNWAAGFSVASLLLFIVTADDISKALVGAMCATGSFNANPVGWYALLSKMAVMFTGLFWMAINRVDNGFEDYPFIRAKYKLLCGFAPLLLVDFILALAYFRGLSPDVITSCCGSLFTENAGRVSETAANTLASADPQSAMVSFYVGALLMALSGASALGCEVGGGCPRWLTRSYALGSGLFFLLSLACIIAFIAPYAYRLPTHHCPFDLFQAQYSYVGYPIYAGLVAFTYYGMLPGLFSWIDDRPTMRARLSGLRRRWIRASFVSLAFFVGMASFPIVFGQTRLYGL